MALYPEPRFPNVRRMRLVLPLLVALVLGPVIGTDPTVAARDRAPGATFRDCPDCPEMVVLPAGSS